MSTNKGLLTREEFKKQVFARTNNKCCVPGCDCDVHHDRDVNAAINIRDFALHRQNLIGSESA